MSNDCARFYVQFSLSGDVNIKGGETLANPYLCSLRCLCYIEIDCSNKRLDVFKIP